jgi:3-hydroxyacyl-[acyl-carrier-protein] dehydratase
MSLDTPVSAPTSAPLATPPGLVLPTGAAPFSLDEVNRRVLKLLPQQRPFRFLDRIVAIDEDAIVGQYRFDPSESFYAGHFPFKPVTPGVILIETMAQTAVVAFGLYLVLLEQLADASVDPERYVAMFAEVQAEFFREVPPGETVTVRGQKVYWRRRKLKATAELFLESGELAASATLGGMGVLK